MSYWPQYTYLALLLIGLGIVMAKHGQPQKPYNLVGSLIASAIGFALLIAGGFFKGVF